MRIEEYSASELFRQLNETDEIETLEAKSLLGDSARSIMETVCSFSNEPGMGGGVILLGVAEAEKIAPTRYCVEKITDLDKAQLDFATRCASMFNFPVRPEISVEQINGKPVLKVFVPELPAGRKPLYLKADGIPKGIWRRIGSCDQRCSEEELSIFYNREEACDNLPMTGATLADIDEDAVERYRFLRRKVNPAAEELSLANDKLLKALGCVNRAHPEQLNIAGTLIFGTASLQRQLIPAARVDYIRVPGTEWVKDPDRSFDTTELRGPLIPLVYRAIDAVRTDLPKGFLLTEDNIQAQSIGLPLRALREAIVNAIMHRSYRVNRPTQIIRYDNRLEIINAGYSLKPEDELGQPGSEVRNPILADVFHEINLAEEKGSGIRRMQRMMAAAHLSAPTFESNRASNTFTVRLLLHHFLGEDDLEWLTRFSPYSLDDNQKKAMIFLREAGAINNLTFRQLSGEDTLRSSLSLRELRDKGLLEQKGTGNATYYVPGQTMLELETLQDKASTLQDKAVTLQGKVGILQDKVAELLRNPQIADVIIHCKKRMKKDELESVICDLCSVTPLESTQIAALLGKNDTYLRTFLTALIKKGALAYTNPDMPTSPLQAYVTVKREQVPAMVQTQFDI